MLKNENDKIQDLPTGKEKVKYDNYNEHYNNDSYD